MKIMGNFFEDNNNAVLLSGGSGSTITQNTFTNNEYALYISASSNNNIYLNNFLSNNHQVTDAGVSSAQVSTQPTKESFKSAGSVQLVTTHVRGVNFMPPPPPSINHWDNGAKGNYWNDYKGSDANEDGIGDIPYNLYENNVDRYPLMKPVAIQEVPIASDSEISPTPTATNLPSSNSTSSEQQNNAETVDSIDEYTIVALPFAGAAVISAYLFLKRKKPATEPA
jgi:parallel beta-helix repeat protein